MEFTFDGKRIVCSRVTVTDAGEQRQEIVDFDDHLDSVPPHVAAQLSAPEIHELELFLSDKQRLQSRSQHTLILEALPGMIDKVRGVLDSLEQIDEPLHQQLTEANQQLESALSRVGVAREEGNPQMEAMADSEALKKRLEIVKRKF